MIYGWGVGVVLAVPLLALTVLFLRWWAVARFHKEIRSFRESTIPPEGHFRGETFGRLASEFFGEMRRFAAPGLATRIDIRRQMEPLAIHLRLVSASTRAVSGLLILSALLFTLFNLQNAVASLAGTFRHIAQSPANETSKSSAKPGDPPAKDSVMQIQQSMSNVAGAASEAFGLSAVSIFSALLLLAASWLSQRHANQTMADFTALAIRVHNTLLLLTEDAEIAAPTNRDMAGGAPIDEAIRGLTKELEAFGGFHSQLRESTEAIKEAVERLPTSINQSMGEVSASVAKQVGDNLTQHYDVLMRIVGIYGDQEKAMADLKRFAGEVSKQSKESSDSLAALKNLVPSLENLSTAVLGLNGDTSLLRGTVKTLDEKVTKLPVTEIGDSVEQLKKSGKELSELLAESRKIQGELSGFLTGWRDALTAELRAVGTVVAARLDDVSSRLEALKGLTSLGKSLDGLHSAVAEVKSALGAATTSINALLELSPSRAQVEEISTRLKQLDEAFHKRWWERLRGK